MSGKCYTYEIWCDSEVYVGFTSRLPHERWQEHVQKAYKPTKRSKTKFYCCLKSVGITKTNSTAHIDELSALLHEIKQIEYYNSHGISLNSTKGGEGNNINVSIKDGKISIKPVSKKTKEQRRKYYSKLSKSKKRQKVRRGKR